MTEQLNTSIVILCTALENYSWAGLLKAIECGTIDVDTAFVNLILF